MEENALLRDMGYTHATIGEETAIFDPKNIRSKFAAFDLDNRDSANLLSGVAPFALFGAGAYGILSEDQPIY